MKGLGYAISISLVLVSSTAVAIPPALPGDDERYAEARKQAERHAADLNSSEVRSLIDLFFVRIGEGEPFTLTDLFTNSASYVTHDGNMATISDAVDSEGFPDIRIWEPISIFRLANGWGAAVRSALDPVGVKEAVLKFSFARNSDGTVRISQIEEVSL